MNDWKNILRDMGYFGVGAAAVLVEAGGKAIKCLVRKGEKVLHDNQDTVDELKEKAKEVGEKIKEAVQELNKKEEAPEVDIPVVDTPEVETPEIEIPEAESVHTGEAPVVPDAIYRTEEPAPILEDEVPAEEDKPKPEETING